MAVNAFLTFYDKADGATDSFRFTDYKPTESLAVDPTNPDVGSSGHTGGANFVFCDGAVRSDEGPQFTTEPTAPQAGGGHEDWIKVESCQLGDPITFTLTIDAPSPAYDDPQLIAIYTRTGYATLETGPAVAMESLTIVNEGFLV